MSEADGVVSVPVDEWASMQARLAELEALTAELAEGRRGVGPPPVAGTSEPGAVVTDRRRVLKHGALLAAGAVAGSAALVASQAGPAAAASGDAMVLGTTMDAGTGTTDIGSAATVATLSAGNSGSGGSAVRGFLPGAANPWAALYGLSFGLGPALYGLITNNASNTQPCILGENNNAHGQAVLGTLGGSANASAAVQGANNTSGLGAGVLGTSFAGNGVEGRTVASGFGAGVYGSAVAGFGVGVHGDCGPGNGLYGSTKSGVAVKGVATTGRGGVFAGQAAQINLTPAAAATHPSNGKSGDLFVDSATRLWLCTVGGATATWKQVQVV